jgi:transposase
MGGMAPDEIAIERLDHLGIVAGICREIGLADYLDAQDERSHERVSVGMATVAMILNGLGFSNRRLYLVPQFFASKPVEHLLGAGIQASDLNDECLGRTLDWLYAHDPTALFAGIAAQARRRFGVGVREVHVDTTSFSVSGEYAAAPASAEGAPPPADAPVGADAQAIAITYGYSRDHRADLKQWMLALATTSEGAVPVFLRPLDGNASDQRELAQTIEALVRHLREAGEEPGIYVADGGVYSEANMRRFAAAGVRWVSRVPETSHAAKALVREEPTDWESSADGTIHWFARQLELPQGQERWIVVVSEAGLARTRATLRQRAEQDREQWERQLWHLGHQEFACEADAHAELARRLKRLPTWLHVGRSVSMRAHYGGRGRPAKDAQPTREGWQVATTVTLDEQRLEREAQRRARFIVATNLLDPLDLSHEAAIDVYKAQSGVERGFAFLKDPLFLASSVFLKKAERIMALALIMVLCLLVYRLAEWRLRQQLAHTAQTVPNQLRQPTDRPTMRWMFECFEGIHLLTLRDPSGNQSRVHGLQPLHLLVLDLLGPEVRRMYK